MNQNLLYVAHCIFCESTDNLYMYAHRKEDKMVGFIFICDECKGKVDDKEIKFFID